MSGGDESQLPAPAANNDKPRPKPVMTSAFINKGAKVFAPKVKGRRRPATSTSTPASSQPHGSTTSTSESQVQPLPSKATNDLATQDTLHPEQPIPASSISVTQAESGAEPSSATAPTTATETSPPDASKNISHVDTLLPVSETGPRPQGRIVEAQINSDTIHTEPTVPHQPHRDPSLPDPTLSLDIDQSQPYSARQPEIEANDSHNHIEAEANRNLVSAPSQSFSSNNQSGSTSGSRTSRVQAIAGPTELPSQTLPWTTVNAPQEDEGDAEADANRKKAATRRRRGPVTLRNIDEEEGSEGNKDAGTVASRRSNAKSRTKKRLAEPATDIDGVPADAAHPAKKTRKTRKSKTKQNAGEAAEAVERGEHEDEEVAAQPKARRKKRTKKAAQVQDSGVAGESHNEEQAPKRKGRPPREDTPSDAENERIDVETTFMGNLAARNIRVGKLSQREKKMREANWDEIKQKWREDEALGSSRSREEQAEALRKLNEAALASGTNQSQGEQLELGEDGQFRLKATARVIDQGAEADRFFENMETVAEDDLTNRITHKSFMRNNKRNPQEFMLPGQGRRWNLKDTNDFYDALRMFGTDFMMISTLFPGATRRSIKLKFVREERADPEGIREALHGQMNSDWNQYLASSGREASDFKDPDEIMRELEEERRSFDVQIAAAKEAAAEEKRQRRLAGLDSEAEEGGENENSHGKKKKGRKEKAVTFADEGVEVLGTVDEDDGWGRE